MFMNGQAVRVCARRAPRKSKIVSTRPSRQSASIGQPNTSTARIAPPSKKRRAFMPCVMRVQDRKAQHAKGHQQARRHYAGDDAEQIRRQSSGRLRRPAPPASVGGKRMAESCGQGRVSRPENFTMRPASQRLKRLVTVASTAAAGGIA